MDSHDHIAIHLDKSAVAVPGKTCIATGCGKRFDGFIIETQVEDGVHHTGHGFASTRANRQKQRIVLVSKFFTQLLFHAANTLLHLSLKHLWIGSLVGVVVGANFRGNGETWRHGQPDAGHFSQIGSFATEKFFHLPVAICLVSEVIYVFNLRGS